MLLPCSLLFPDTLALQRKVPFRRVLGLGPQNFTNRLLLLFRLSNAVVSHLDHIFKQWWNEGAFLTWGLFNTYQAQSCLTPLLHHHTSCSCATYTLARYLYRVEKRPDAEPKCSKMSLSSLRAVHVEHRIGRPFVPSPSPQHPIVKHPLSEQHATWEPPRDMTPTIWGFSEIVQFPSVMVYEGHQFTTTRPPTSSKNRWRDKE